MVFVPLTLFRTTVVVPIWDDGRYLSALVDQQDGVSVSARRWFLHRREGYPTTIEQGRKLRLHRFVFGPIEPGQVIDHINGDKLDNRSANLRAVDKSKNGLNRHRANKNNKSSGTPGVCWSKGEEKWRVQIRCNGKDHFGGYYADETQAKEAATRLRTKLFEQQEARLNS